jgi:hypothetical protein
LGAFERRGDRERHSNTGREERDFSATLSSSEKIAVFAPMPSASDTTAAAVTTGVARSDRMASRRSCT